MNNISDLAVKTFADRKDLSNTINSWLDDNAIMWDDVKAIKQSCIPLNGEIVTVITVWYIPHCKICNLTLNYCSCE